MQETEFYRYMDQHPKLDEFFGISASIVSTLIGHTSGGLLLERGGWWFREVHFPSDTSPATVAAVSCMLRRMLLDPRSRGKGIRQLLVQHILDLGIPGVHALAAPSVKRHFFQASVMIQDLIEAAPHDEGLKLLEFPGFNARSLLDQLDEIIQQRMNAPEGYPNSMLLLQSDNVFGLLLVLMSASWPLRDSYRKAGDAERYLNRCKALFPLAKTHLVVHPIHNFLLNMLFLVLYMMDTNPTNNHKLSAGSVEPSLSSNDKKALIPHFTWIQSSLHSFATLPDHPDFQRRQAGVSMNDLIARGFSAIGLMFQVDDPSLFVTGRLPTLAATLGSRLLSPLTSTPKNDHFDYMTAVSCARNTIESILRHTKQNGCPSPSIALGDLLSSLLTFGVAQDDACHALFTDLAHLLTDSLRGSNAACLSAADVATVIREWQDNFDTVHESSPGDSGWRAHAAWSTVARIFLQCAGMSHHFYSEDLVTGLQIVLVAWGDSHCDHGHGIPPVRSDSAAGHNQTRTCVVKITPRIVQETLSLLSRVPPDVAGENLAWIEEASRNRRGDGELDFPDGLSSKEGRELLEGVHAVYNRLKEVSPVTLEDIP